MDVAGASRKPTPVLVTQLVVLVRFVWLGKAALRGFQARPAAMVS